MCFSSKQPAAPVNTPDYAPDESWKHFKTTKTDEGGKKTDLKPVTESPTPRTAVPKIKATQNQIRM